MKIKSLARWLVLLALLPACNLFGLYQPVSALPTTTLELTLNESPPDSSADPQFDAVKAKSKDGQLVTIDITVLFKIDPAMANHILAKWGESYGTGFLVPTLRHATEEAISQYTGYEIYGEGRLNLGKTIQEAVIESFSAEGFVVQDVLIRNIHFTEEFTAKIEQEISATMTVMAQQIKATPTP